jgi:hypothetical protein
MFMPQSNPAGKTSPATWTTHAAQPLFTMEEHLRLQRQIEERAHQLWQAHGGDRGNPLDDWLKAENKVLVEFITTRTRCEPARAVLRKTQTKTITTSTRPATVTGQCAAGRHLMSTPACHYSL